MPRPMSRPTHGAEAGSGRRARSSVLVVSAGSWEIWRRSAGRNAAGECASCATCHSNCGRARHCRAGGGGLEELEGDATTWAHGRSVCSGQGSGQLLLDAGRVNRSGHWLPGADCAETRRLRHSRLAWCWEIWRLCATDADMSRNALTSSASTIAGSCSTTGCTRELLRLREVDDATRAAASPAQAQQSIGFDAPSATVSGNTPRTCGASRSKLKSNGAITSRRGGNGSAVPR